MAARGLLFYVNNGDKIIIIILIDGLNSIVRDHEMIHVMVHVC